MLKIREKLLLFKIKEPVSFDTYFIAFSFLVAIFAASWYFLHGVESLIHSTLDSIALKNPDQTSFFLLRRTKLLDWSMYLLSFSILPILYIFLLNLFTKIEMRYQQIFTSSISSINVISHFAYWALVMTIANLLGTNPNANYWVFSIATVIFFILFIGGPLILIKLKKSYHLHTWSDILSTLKHIGIPLVGLYIILLFNLGPITVFFSKLSTSRHIIGTK